ncbi:hypothetical protein [Pedobacter sp. MR2016-24]|uniref:hypothetical protein n=1 Tax=Pedobacter sp. MR2016-24 TaxID=2994466 RepID=UPI002246D05B|nr:hypothetical protein [Pedobacter sp. MR2016-24]MCX2484526.1 hypothetical protein [Pedobacter sp. MR2016-24]
MEEKKELTPLAAFEIVYRATGTLQLNRADGQLLDNSLRVLAGLLPQETEVPVED